MSLDIYLTLKGGDNGSPDATGIFVRENGSTREITRAEWDEKFPGMEPVTADIEPGETEVFWANITHNLGNMADEAGIYGCVWRPEENGVESAGQLIEPLTKAIADMKARPKHYEKFNSPNGWGLYENFVPWLERLLEACTAWPDAEVYSSR